MDLLNKSLTLNKFYTAYPEQIKGLPKDFNGKIYSEHLSGEDNLIFVEFADKSVKVFSVNDTRMVEEDIFDNLKAAFTETRKWC